jgi:hypothetical protein
MYVINTPLQGTHAATIYLSSRSRAEQERVTECTFYADYTC